MMFFFVSITWSISRELIEKPTGGVPAIARIRGMFCFFKARAFPS